MMTEDVALHLFEDRHCLLFMLIPLSTVCSCDIVMAVVCVCVSSDLRLLLYVMQGS